MTTEPVSDNSWRSVSRRLELWNQYAWFFGDTLAVMVDKWLAKQEDMFALVHKWLKQSGTETSDEAWRQDSMESAATYTIYTIQSAEEWQQQYWCTRPEVLDTFLQDKHWGVEWFDLCMEMVQCRTILYEIASALRRVDRLCLGLGVDSSSSSMENTFLFSEQITQMGVVEFDERYHARILQLFPGESYTCFFDALHQIWSQVDQMTMRLDDQCEFLSTVPTLV